MGLPYGVLDILPISIAGVVCTLATIFWAMLMIFRHIRKCIDSHCESDTEMATPTATSPTSNVSNVSNTSNVGTTSVSPTSNVSTTHGQVEGEDETDGVADTIANADKRFRIKTKIHWFVRYFFPFLKAGKKDSRGDSQTLLLGYKVPSIFVEQLLLFSFVVLALSVQVAISNYLFIKSYGCSTEPYVHCFEAKAHFLAIGHEELDCTNSTALENITSIICYDLTLNVKLAFSEAGTVLASGAFYFVFITWLLLTLSSMKCWETKDSKNKITERRGKCVIILSIQLGIMLVSLCVIHARIVALVTDRDTVYEDFVHLFIKTYVVIIGGVFPWRSFKCVDGEQCDRQNSQPEERSTTNEPQI